MENLEIYEKVRAVPKEAQKAIGGGRLKGMTDINPMWRIKKLTELFGPCGFGWYYDVSEHWIETSMAKDEITANVKINLYIKYEGEWSKAITGIGGSMLVANEKNGLYVNDECFKMALTDALSVACKSLGIGADIYWNKDTTKYNDIKKENLGAKSVDDMMELPATDTEKRVLMELCREKNLDINELLKSVGWKEGSVFTKGQHGKALIKLNEVVR